MELIVFAPLGLFALVMAYQFGTWTTKAPTESEMIERIIQARFERKLAAITRDDLNKEIDGSVERLVERHGR